MFSLKHTVREHSLAVNKEHSFEGEADYFIPDAESRKQRGRHSWIWRPLNLSILVGQVLLLVANTYGLTFTMKSAHRDSVSSKFNLYGTQSNSD
jgi:hypothetical protein